MNLFNNISIFTSNSKQNIILNGFVVILSSVLLALSAQISIPTLPIPFTMQPFAVMLLGILLDKRLSVLSVLLYILEGLFGFPVFSNFGFGIVKLLSPTGGFIIGFIPAVYFSSIASELCRSKKFISSLAFLFLAQQTMFLCGICWLSLYVGIKQAIILGYLPFIVFDAIKLISVSFFMIGNYKFNSYLKSK